MMTWGEFKKKVGEIVPDDAVIDFIDVDLPVYEADDLEITVMRSSEHEHQMHPKDPRHRFNVWCR